MLLAMFIGAAALCVLLIGLAIKKENGRALFAALAVLYMLALGQRKPLREVAAGVGASLAAWLGVSVAFSVYVEHLADYTRLYGSITAVVVTLLWLYISATVLIMGAELNAVVRRKAPQRKE